MRIVYITTNLVNGKRYVGQTKTDNDDYVGSGRRMKAALKKYGKHNFSRRTLETLPDHDRSNKAEIFWITFYDAVNDPMFYNVANGGEGRNQTGWKHTVETRAKQSAAHMGRVKSPEHRKNLGLAQTKSFAVRDPDGVVHTGYGIRDFAVQHGLNQGALSQVLLGKSKHHKQWTLA